jgi:hypothetical protein
MLIEESNRELIAAARECNEWQPEDSLSSTTSGTATPTLTGPIVSTSLGDHPKTAIRYDSKAAIESERRHLASAGQLASVGLGDVFEQREAGTSDRAGTSWLSSAADRAGDRSFVARPGDYSKSVGLTLRSPGGWDGNLRQRWPFWLLESPAAARLIPGLPVTHPRMLGRDAGRIDHDGGRHDGREVLTQNVKNPESHPDP